MNKNANVTTFQGKVLLLWQMLRQLSRKCSRHLIFKWVETNYNFLTVNLDLCCFPRCLLEKKWCINCGLILSNESPGKWLCEEKKYRLWNLIMEESEVFVTVLPVTHSPIFLQINSSSSFYWNFPLVWLFRR